MSEHAPVTQNVCIREIAERCFGTCKCAEFNLRPTTCNRCWLEKRIAQLLADALREEREEGREGVWQYVKEFIERETEMEITDDGSTFEDWFRDALRKEGKRSHQSGGIDAINATLELLGYLPPIDEAVGLGTVRVAVKKFGERVRRETLEQADTVFRLAYREAMADCHDREAATQCGLNAIRALSAR